jgi:hypothetical protein
MWQDAKRSNVHIPLDRLYGGGVNLIAFQSPNREGQEKQFIQFSPDHTTARTIISRYSGGLNGDGTEVTLKKIDDQWFAVDLQLRYVS